MTTSIKKIDRDLQNWEAKIQDISEHAETLRPLKRLEIYQDIFAIEKKILNLKSTLRMFKYFPGDEYTVKRHKLDKAHSDLKRNMQILKLITFM